MGRLSPRVRQIAHVLRTRSPVTLAGPRDLHVLSTPPAFVLSQDQTLQWFCHRSLLIGSSSRSAPKGDRSESLNEFRLISRCSPDQPQVLETAPHIHRSHLRLSNSVLLSLRNRLRLRHLASFLWPPFQRQPIYLPSCCELVNTFSHLFFRGGRRTLSRQHPEILGRRRNSFLPS